MESPALHELQESFFAYVAGAAPSGPEAELALAAVREHGALDADQRLGIYRGMCFARLVDVLRDDYATVAEALGEEAFEALARRYLEAHPSSRPTIQHVGERFPAFLEVHAEDRPQLGEMGRLALARLEVFAESDAEPLTLDELREIPPGEWGDVPLRPIPALRVVTRAWSDAGQPKAHALRVWRQGFEVFHAAMTPMEAQGVDLLRTGRATLSSLGDLLGAEHLTDDPPRDAAGLLLRWLEDGVLDAGAQRRSPPASISA